MPKPTKAELLARRCPKCDAGPGERCHNGNRPCRMHKERKPRHVPNVDKPESYAASEASRRRIAGKAATDLAQAVAVCGYFPGAKYGKWRFRDRTGALPDVVVFKCYRPGVPRSHEEYAADFPGHGERLGPPFLAFYSHKPGGDDSPGGFGFRWETSWNSIEVPNVRTAEQLQKAAEKRRAKELARQQAEAAKLAEWKRRNVAPSLFEGPTS